MPFVRCLNEEGVREFAAYLARLASDGSVSPPTSLLEDPRFTRATRVGPVMVEHRAFSSRREFADYLDACCQKANVELTDEAGLWEWLSLFYFDAVCPPDARGQRRPGAANRHLVDSAFARRRNRHLLRGPYMLHRRYAGGAEGELDLLLGYALPVHGVAATHLAERPRLFGSRGVLIAASRLYSDSVKKRPKPGYADETNGLRAFCRFLNNLPASFDLADLAADTVLALLPGEFGAWLENVDDETLRLRQRVQASRGTEVGEPWANTLDDLLQHAQDRPLATAQRRVRSDLFRVGVLAAYDARCTVSGLGLAHTAGDAVRYEVEAAHIVPVAQGGKDLIQNGLALSRTVHWAFDLGMVWVDNHLRLDVAAEVLRDSRNAWLANLRGRPLAMPADPRLRPQGDALRWHAAQVAGLRRP